MIPLVPMKQPWRTRVKSTYQTKTTHNKTWPACIVHMMSIIDLLCLLYDNMLLHNKRPDPSDLEFILQGQSIYSKSMHRILQGQSIYSKSTHRRASIKHRYHFIHIIYWYIHYVSSVCLLYDNILPTTKGNLTLQTWNLSYKGNQYFLNPCIGELQYSIGTTWYISYIYIIYWYIQYASSVVLLYDTILPTTKGNLILQTWVGLIRTINEYIIAISMETVQ